MKTKIVSLGLTLIVSSLVSAQPVMTSYADVFSTTENRLINLSSTRKIEDTAVASAAYASFATKIVFPEGTTLVRFSAASFAVESYVNNLYTLHTPVGVNMAGSQFNPEDDISLPSIFARSSDGSLILPTGAALVGTSVPNVRSFFITEHKANLPQLVNVGDYWKLYRSLTGTYTIGDGLPIAFNFADQVATVRVVNETNIPVSGVSMDYPNNPKVISTSVLDGTATLIANGLTVDSYNKTWWMETSTNLSSWSIVTPISISPNVTIMISFNSTDPRRFWRISGLKP